MTGPDFTWLRPRVIGLDADTLGKARAYEAKHSLPGYEPSPELRDRVLALTRLVPQMPACEADEDGPDISCITCEDSGGIRVGEWGLPFPCPDCPRSDDWTWHHELWDDARRGK